MRRWVWGTYTLSLAWVGILLFYVHGFLAASGTGAFRREGRRLTEVWAERFSDAGSDEARRGALLRRLAGDSDVRAAALLDDQRLVLENIGGPVPPLLSALSEPADRSLDPSTWAFWAPIWMDGRRSGYLALVRDASPLKKDREHNARGLLAAWAWWAAAGALGAVFASRAARPSPPNS